MKQTATAMMAVTALLLFSTAQVAAQVPVFNSGPSTYGSAPNVPHIFMFESLEADTLFLGSYGSTPEDDTDRDYFYWSEWEGEPYEGEGSLLLDWGMFSDASWGGSSALQHFLPDSANGELRTQFYDFSDFTHISLWHNTLVPADPAATMRLKLHDASEGLGTAPSSETEDWYSEWSDVYQAQPGWNEIRIPLESLGNVGPGTGGFSRPGCPSSCWSGIYGNGELDLDKISGFQIEVTGPQFGPTADSSSAGTVVWDAMYVSGVRYNLVHGFDSDEDLDHWKNSDAGSYTLTVVDDTAQGTGAIELDYNLVADQSWGGSVDIDFKAPEGTFLEDMSSRTHLSLFYKVIEPASVPGQISLTFKLWDNSTGALEEWQYGAGAIYEDTTGTWRRLLVPLKEAVGDQPGFAIPSWVGEKGDNTLNLDKIVGFQLQLAGATGTTTTGKILFDRMTGYGLQETDFEAPAAVEGLSALASAYNNIVSWTDVPGEEGEMYHLYASESPITDVSAAGVMLLERNISEGTEVYVHRIFAPIVDADVTMYYAITASDPAGNVSEPAASDAVTNTAKGLPSISLDPPEVTADGDLSEWSGIAPFHLEPGGDLGHVPTVTDPPYVVNDAADLSADVYMAIDSEALYFAAAVTDEAFFPVPEGHTTNRWTFDGMEVYIGFYDGRKEEHESYEGDAEPDYKFYLYSENMISDQVDGDVLVTGDGNYMFMPTDLGYNIEARIPFDAIGLADFVPLNGMRVPLDFVIMDNDLGGQDNREGLMAYSFWNDDNSYLSPTNWFYAWIGNKASVGVELLDMDVPSTFVLEQNYPNPFNPSTVIRYALPEESDVTLKVFNMIGQEVTTLVSADQAAGVYEVRFDASQLSSGLYLYQLQAGNTVLSNSMLLNR